MKPLPKILLALTAVAALSVACPAKANLITNPGFETGDFTGWTAGAGASVVGTSNGVSPHSGSFQAKVFPLSLAVISQTLATMAGQSSTVSFWTAASANPFQAGLGVFWGGSTSFNI